MVKRIFLAGATGAVGRRLVPALVHAGYDVVGTTRSTAKAADLRAAGAEPVVVDALDPEAVMTAVGAARPDLVIHQLTALSRLKSLKHFDKEFAATNRLRTTGLDNLLAAAVAAGAERFIAQSYTGWPNERMGGSIKTEDDRFDPKPTSSSRESLAAIRYLESTVTGSPRIEGTVLRYGMLYGPGTDISIGGRSLELIRRRSFPVVGGGRGIWSFVHIDDAAGATVAAIERDASGVYNIVDDEPASVAEWLPFLAETIGAKRPMRVPAWLVRPFLGEQGVSMMTAIRGSSNAKAKCDLGWQPIYPSWRRGFIEGLE